ncbi:hypothetical protein METH_09660 [Leisingera methylohalidivorans DSM 14336]|uniref:Transposase n=1 Tax=Leisingera methylohalidivorans DSM 14336 TaxID=999552 RepID=V9W080_9RHOB|nr:hypothetical protein METH_09660 [Leisingera methylohalidivorans DSM 14336]
MLLERIDWRVRQKTWKPLTAGSNPAIAEP